MLTQKNTIKDVKETVHQLQEQACNKARDLQEDIEEAAHNAGQKVREIYNTAAYESRDAVAVTQKQIRRHPLVATAGALGLGVLLGVLFRRR